MKTALVIGIGRFGANVAVNLERVRYQVMAVDEREDRINEILSQVTSAQIGDCTSQEFLVSLGIEDFDLCIVAIGDSFQNSLEATSLLKELGAKYVVSRATHDIHEKFLLRNGADEVVFPERQMAEWTAKRFSAEN